MKEASWMMIDDPPRQVIMIILLQLAEATMGSESGEGAIRRAHH
jgi:hypothetical protein